MHLWYAVFFVALAGGVFRVRSGKKLMALTLTGALLLSFVASPLPARAQVQNGILGSIQAVLGVINGLIQTALVAINNVRIALSNLEQIVVWPQQLINQARGQVLLLIAQYRNLMWSLLHIRLHSATLPAPQAFEVLIRDHQVNNFSALSTAYANNYGLVPLATDANSSDRGLTDMD